MSNEKLEQRAVEIINYLKEKPDIRLFDLLSNLPLSEGLEIMTHIINHLLKNK